MAACAVMLAAGISGLLAQDQEIRVFSHRGGRLENDENTIQAFRASYDAGYRGFETDFRMTRDGALVVT
ncbi:MAG: glycerophosphodiester phosphodiesterase, partial [Muribaculaceae bacterium]|nr:glycerophosphodiester phosphodiesterase [Muribaculaceae bacterium]